MQLKEHEGIVARKDSFVIDPRILKTELGYNVRDLNAPECKEHIASLKESIAANSVRVPLEVRLKGEDIYIVAGHCRWMAVMELIAEGHDEIKGVPCVQEPKSINDAERTLNLAISNSGKPLTTLEIAEVVKRLEGFGWTPEQIQRRMQWKSRATVTQHEEIAALSEGTKTHIKNGEISPTLARNIAKGVDPEKAEELIRANLEENKRIKGTGKRNVKVTAGTLKRDAKPKPQTEPLWFRQLTGSYIETDDYRTTEELRLITNQDPSGKLAIGTDYGKWMKQDGKDLWKFYKFKSPTPPPPTVPEQAPPIAASAPPEHLPPAPQLVMPESSASESPPPPHTITGLLYAPPHSNIIKQLIEALEPFARIGQHVDLNEKSDDDLCVVRFEHIKRAWVAFAKVAGNGAGE